jgi:MFS family permease
MGNHRFRRIPVRIMAAGGSDQGDVASEPAASFWSPFRNRFFTVLWSATVIADIGWWMFSAAAGWLMTILNPDPRLVSMVEVASSLPLFLFALPAGALTDIVDNRKLLIAAEIAISMASLTLSALVFLHLVTPAILLLFVFLISIGDAVTAPAYQSIVPELLPQRELQEGIAANSVAVNLSRGIGPAIGGIIIPAFGIATPFLINGISNAGLIGTLSRWHPSRGHRSNLPAERFASALRTGFRHARYNVPLRATLTRVAAFYFFASAYWALLPLVARTRIAAGPELYGLLLGAIGLGAVCGVFILSRLEERFTPDRLVAIGTAGTVAAVVLFALAREPMMALLASIIAGICWIIVMASLTMSAQVALPNWVRGRGLSVYVTVFAGSMTLGSLIWGQIASLAGLPVALFIAAGGALLSIPLTRRWKLHTRASIDVTPSMHWLTPTVVQEVEKDRGPVMVTTEYRILVKDRDAFLVGMYELARERRRDGAYAWVIVEDTAQIGRFVETFFVESWLEHLRQHERVTNTSRALEERMLTLHQGPRANTTHFISAKVQCDSAGDEA